MANQFVMIRISIIVATYNRGHQLVRTLQSLASQTLQSEQWEAVIENNNSTDDTQRLFDDFLKDTPGAGNIRMVFEGRQGLSHARNRGISECQGMYIAIIDDDEQVNPDFTSQHAVFFYSHTDAAAAGGKIKP